MKQFILDFLTKISVFSFKIRIFNCLIKTISQINNNFSFFTNALGNKNLLQ